MAESVEEVRTLLNAAIAAWGSALARRNYAKLDKADENIDALLDRLVKAAQEEGRQGK